MASVMPAADSSEARRPRTPRAPASLPFDEHEIGTVPRVCDHVVPLKRTDDPSNMQWQTTSEAKAKDRTEWGTLIPSRLDYALNHAPIRLTLKSSHALLRD